MIFCFLKMTHYSRVIRPFFINKKIWASNVRFCSTETKESEIQDDILIEKTPKLDKYFQKEEFNLLFEKEIDFDLLKNYVASKQKGELTYEEISKNEDFQFVCSKLLALKKQSSTIYLVNYLKALKDIGTPNSHEVINALQKELYWHVHMASPEQLLFILKYQENNRETTIQYKIFKEGIEKLVGLVHTFLSMKDIIRVYRLYKHLPKNFVNNELDPLVLQSVENFEINDILNLYETMAESKVRPMTVIKALAYNLYQGAENLDAKQLGKLLNSMAALSYYDTALLSKISLGDVDISTITPNNCTSILVGLGKMKWYNENLLNYLINCVIFYKDDNPKLVATLLKTLAIVNYAPPQLDKLFGELSNVFEINLKQDFNIWLNYVYNLAILGKVNAHHIDSVLSKAKIDQLNSTNLKYVIILDAVAQYIIKDYKGSRLNLENRSITSLLSSDDKEIYKAAVQAIRTMTTPEKVDFNIDTKMGFDIMAEIIVNYKGEMLNKSDYLKSNLSDMNSELDSSEGVHRVALVYLSFFDHVVGKNDHLTGQKQLFINLLEARGCKVVPIPSQSVSLNNLSVFGQTLIQKIQEAISK